DRRDLCRSKHQFSAIRRIVRGATDLLGPKAVAEDSEEVGLDAIAEDTRLVELGIDEMADLGVRLCELAPMQARAFMVRRVIAVIEDEPISELGDEVTRVVVERPRIG